MSHGKKRRPEPLSSSLEDKEEECNDDDEDLPPTQPCRNRRPLWKHDSFVEGGEYYQALNERPDNSGKSYYSLQVPQLAQQELYETIGKLHCINRGKTFAQRASEEGCDLADMILFDKQLGPLIQGLVDTIYLSYKERVSRDFHWCYNRSNNSSNNNKQNCPTDPQEPAAHYCTWCKRNYCLQCWKASKHSQTKCLEDL